MGCVVMIAPVPLDSLWTVVRERYDALKYVPADIAYGFRQDDLTCPCA
jgi:hypothetical protein